MRFWDTSAVVPLLIAQPSTESLRRLFDEDPRTCVWTLTEIEARSALARLERDGALDAAGNRRAGQLLDHFRMRAHIIERVESVKKQASRLLRLHALRAVDALQLGAALVYAGHEPIGTKLVCLDTRLADAARREGFDVLPE